MREKKGKSEPVAEILMPESHDDDLAWILDKLTERSGAAFGIMYRFIEEDDQAVVLARCARGLSLSDNACVQIEAVARRRHLDQDPSSEIMLQLKSIDVDDDATPNLRLLHMRFAAAPGVVVVAVVCRPEFTSVLLREFVARRLYPVLARYIHLWWLHRTERRRAAALKQALEISNLGVVQLDRRGSILYANTCATRLLNESEGLRRGNTITSSNEYEGMRLQAAVQRAVLSNRIHAGGDNPAVMLSLQRAGQRALIVTIVSVAQKAIDPGDPAAIVYLLDPEHDVSEMIAPACRLYGLTAVEVRLVTNLVNGATLAEAAARMHVALQTARTYLKQIFQKTATNRQVELLRLMLASAVRAGVGQDVTLL